MNAAIVPMVTIPRIASQPPRPQRIATFKFDRIPIMEKSDQGRRAGRATG